MVHIAGHAWAKYIAGTRQYSSLEPPAPSLPAVRGALDARRIRRVTEYIDARLGENLSIETLAGQASLSLFHFARAFKSATGKTPHRFVIERRIGRAKTLLGESREPIAAVAELCGFASQAHLSRWFKRLVGVTPGSYRRSAHRSTTVGTCAMNTG